MKKKEPSPLSPIAQELFKGVRKKEDFNKIVSELIKHGIETVLKAELDEHLGNEKNEASTSGNHRNGYSEKTVKGSIGDLALSIPRDRQATFEPQLIPKHQRMIDNIEEALLHKYFFKNYFAFYCFLLSSHGYRISVWQSKLGHFV